MRSHGSKLAFVLVLLAAGACSADPDSQGIAVPVSSPRSTATPTPAGETVFFTSPTGNIACSMGGPNAVCEIREHTFAKPDKPPDCDLDYGTMVGVEGRRAARFLCHGDTAFGATGSVVAYGERLTNGLVTCTSRESGMTCSSADGAHGFVLSRASYRLY